MTHPAVVYGIKDFSNFCAGKRGWRAVAAALAFGLERPLGNRLRDAWMKGENKKT